MRLSRLFIFFVDLDAERFQKLQILIADLEFRIGRKRSDKGCFVCGFIALLAHPDGSFKDQENIVSTFFDAGHDF
jgi:hypothetical protein